MPNTCIYQLQKWWSVRCRASCHISFSFKQEPGTILIIHYLFDQCASSIFISQDLIFLCLPPKKVFDLGEDAPDKVLHRLYLTLENLKLNGDELATKIENHLRVIVSFF